MWAGTHRLTLRFPPGVLRLRLVYARDSLRSCRDRVHVAAADFEDAGGELIDEIAVMRDEDDCAGIFYERFEKDILGAQVKVVGGFVEQQEVCGMEEHFQQRVAVALATGEDSDTLEDIVA